MVLTRNLEIEMKVALFIVLSILGILFAIGTGSPELAWVPHGIAVVAQDAIIAARPQAEVAATVGVDLAASAAKKGAKAAAKTVGETLTELSK